MNRMIVYAATRNGAVVGTRRTQIHVQFGAVTISLSPAEFAELTQLVNEASSRIHSAGNVPVPQRN